MSRYELFAREGAGSWTSLGTFQGNTDATTEVVHSFASIKGATGRQSGVRARYLRVVPVSNVNGGAMRVGVYGFDDAGGAEGGKRGRKGSLAKPKGCPDSRAMANDETTPSLITYTLSRPAEDANARYHHHNVMWNAGGFWRDKSNGPKVRRNVRRLAARQVVADARKVRCLVQLYTSIKSGLRHLQGQGQ